MTKQKTKKSIEKLNDLFPLPNPSSREIEKTFSEMGKSTVKETKPVKEDKETSDKKEEDSRNSDNNPPCLRITS